MFNIWLHEIQFVRFTLQSPSNVTTSPRDNRTSGVVDTTIIFSPSDNSYFMKLEYGMSILTTVPVILTSISISRSNFAISAIVHRLAVLIPNSS